MDIVSNDPAISMQPFNLSYCVACYYNPQHLNPQTIKALHDANFNCILSHDVYIDILPYNVDKGATLIRLLNHFRYGHDDVVVCGDSLNDLPLFRTGLRSIVVGNAEPKLYSHTQSLPNAFHSNGDGALGILEGLAHFDKLSTITPI